MTINIKKIAAGLAIAAALTGAATALPSVTHSASAAGLSGYIHDGSQYNGGYRWYEDGKLYTGFRYYMGTYYWFVDGVRQNAGWRQAWGLKYYTDNNGRAVQGNYVINGHAYNFGNDGTYYLRGNASGYLHDGSAANGGYRWYENGTPLQQIQIHD